MPSRAGATPISRTSPRPTSTAPSRKRRNNPPLGREFHAFLGPCVLAKPCHMQVEDRRARPADLASSHVSRTTAGQLAKRLKLLGNPLGNGVTVAQQTLTLFVLVRIQVPQPPSVFSYPHHQERRPRSKQGALERPGHAARLEVVPVLPNPGQPADAFEQGCSNTTKRVRLVALMSSGRIACYRARARRFAGVIPSGAISAAKGWIRRSDHDPHRAASPVRHSRPGCCRTPGPSG